MFRTVSFHLEPDDVTGRGKYVMVLRQRPSLIG